MGRQTDARTKINKRMTESATQIAPSDRLDVAQLVSWLPIDASVQNGQPVIEWMDMSGVRLVDPFFAETVSRVRKDRVNQSTITTDFETLLELEKLTDSVAPTGFIFHSSRCGSTLLVNACQRVAGSIVIAEAPAVDKTISRFFTFSENDHAKVQIYPVFVRAIVAALAQRRFDDERRCFVKFAATSALQFSHIRKLWPNVPSVFLYRDPVETIVSNMSTVPDWLRVETNPDIAAAIVGVAHDELRAMSVEEYCARALGQYYSAGLQMAESGTMLVNYSELSGDSLLKLLEFFCVEPDAEETSAIIEAARFYSKDSNHQRYFRDDSQAKQSGASDFVKAAAGKWAIPAYERLTEFHTTSCRNRLN